MLVWLLLPLGKALCVGCVSVVAWLGHGSEVRPLEPEVWAFMDALAMVDYLGQRSLVLALV